MNRPGALAPGKTPVVNAATALTAHDAGLLDGLDSADFMPSGDVTVVEMGDWSSIDVNTGVVYIGGKAQLNNLASQTANFNTPLRGPIVIGYQPYALKQVVVCSGGYNNTTNFELLSVFQGGDTLAQILTPESPPSNGSCYTLDVSSPAYYAMDVPILVATISAISSGCVSIRVVRTVWTPVAIAPR